MCMITNQCMWFCYRLLFRKILYSLNLLLWLFSSIHYVCMQGINCLWLNLEEQVILGLLQWDLLLKTKRSQSLLYLIYFILLRIHGQQCLFGYSRQNFNAHWYFCFFIWHLGLADICQRPYNVFLICSIKKLAQAFRRMWTCCNRNWQRGWGSQRQVSMTCITVSQKCI